MQRQLELDLGMPKDYEALYKRLGIDPKARGKKKGLPGLGEDSLFVFFPTLHEGIVTPDGIHLKLEKRNVEDIYDIDYHILKDGEPIAFIDHEQRVTQDFPFTHPWADINIPLHSHRSNIEQWNRRPWSRKAEYYRRWPERCFHLVRRSNLKEAICCHAKDFVHLKPVWDKGYGGMLVWKAPRAKACFGREYEHDIEDWVLLKLEKEGLLR